jgi:hypothetical protein
MRRLVLGTSMALVGCFRGEATLGAVCGQDADCGADQACDNEVCGYCGDGIAQAGELCSVAAVELGMAPRASAGELLALDLGRDGTIELLARGDDGTVELWRGDGEGGFTVGTRVTEGGHQGPVRLGELDEDDAVDLVVVDAEARVIGLGYGTGDGHWSFAGTVALDGVPWDLAVGGARGEGPAWVAWADERGLWRAVVDPQTRTLGAEARLAGARTQWLGEPVALDEDGALDLLVADVDGMRLEPWLADGAGELVRGEPVELEGRATALVTVDVDGDGDADALVPDEEGGVTVIVSDAEGGLVSAGRATVPAAAREVAVADLDRDGDRDLVVVVEHESPLWLLRLRGGSYSDPIALPAAGAVGAVLARDIDRDGLVELLLGPSDGVAALRVVEVEP